MLLRHASVLTVLSGPLDFKGKHFTQLTSVVACYL